MCSIYKLYQTEHVNYTSIKIGFKSEPIMMFKKERERKVGGKGTLLFTRDHQPTINAEGMREAEFCTPLPHQTEAGGHRGEHVHSAPKEYSRMAH